VGGSSFVAPVLVLSGSIVADELEVVVDASVELPVVSALLWPASSDPHASTRASHPALRGKATEEILEDSRVRGNFATGAIVEPLAMPPCSRRCALGALAGTALAACDSVARARWVDEMFRAATHAEPIAPRSPPGPAALGSLGDLGPADRLAFTDTRGFAPLPAPRPREWRAIRSEPAQSVDDFLANEPRARMPPRDALALMPLGRFPFDVLEGPEFVGLVRTPPLADLAAFVAAFFATRTTVLPISDFPADELPWREIRGHRQYEAPTLLHRTAAGVPEDAHGMIVLVNVDLFAWSEQEFAFGFTLDRERLAVVGFSRYDPSFFGGERPEDLEAVILARSLRVLVHEIGHVFGLAHCLHFRCVMNGVAHLGEVDALPLHLCPVCLRKLQLVTGLDPRENYRALAPIAERLGLAAERQWLHRRLAVLDHAKTG
jgi:archaemetzincin